MVRRDVVAARPLAQQLHRAELGHQVGERAPVASEESERRSLVEARVFFGIAHAADDLAAHRLGEIEAGPEHRDQRSEERLQRLAGDDLVAVRNVGELYARQARDGRAPGARGDHHAIGGDAAAIGLHRAHAALAHLDAGGARERLYLRAPPARAVGISPEERPGEDAAVVRVPGSRDEFRGIELGNDLGGLAGRDHAGGETVPLLEFGAVLDAAQRLIVVRQEQVAAAAEPDVDPELLREAGHEGDGFLGQLDQRGRRPLRAHAAAVAARRALAEVAALEDQDAPRPQASEVPGQRQAHDAAPDDDDVHPLRQRGVRLQRMRALAPGGTEAARRVPGAGDFRGQACIRGDGGRRERRARAKGHLRCGGHRVASGADAHGAHLAALSLAGSGAQPGVALEALDVGVSVCDGALDVVDADVLAGAEDGFLAQRHAALPAVPPDRAASLRATVPAAKSQGTLVRPSASVSTGNPAPSTWACAPTELASSCSGAGGIAMATASQRIRSPLAVSTALTGLPNARRGTPGTIAISYPRRERAAAQRCASAPSPTTASLTPTRAESASNPRAA